MESPWQGSAQGRRPRRESGGCCSSLRQARIRYCASHRGEWIAAGVSKTTIASDSSSARPHLRRPIVAGRRLRSGSHTSSPLLRSASRDPGRQWRVRVGVAEEDLHRLSFLVALRRHSTCRRDTGKGLKPLVRPGLVFVQALPAGRAGRAARPRPHSRIRRCGSKRAGRKRSLGVEPSTASRKSPATASPIVLPPPRRPSTRPERADRAPRAAALVAAPALGVRAG